MRRVATAHQRLYCALSRLVVEAGKPISDQLAAAAAESARLRTQLSKAEAELARRERMFVTLADSAPPGWRGQ